MVTRRAMRGHRRPRQAGRGAAAATKRSLFLTDPLSPNSVGPLSEVPPLSDGDDDGVRRRWNVGFGGDSARGRTPLSSSSEDGPPPPPPPERRLASDCRFRRSPSARPRSLARSVSHLVRRGHALQELVYAGPLGDVDLRRGVWERGKTRGCCSVRRGVVVV